MNRLKDKVAVITGGNSGIGKGIAKRFLEEGAKVVIFGRNAEKLKQTKSELSEDVLAIQGDVVNTEDLYNLFNETSSHFGKIDILVANAGVAKGVHLKDITEDDFDYMVNINYRGLFFTVRYAIEYMNDDASIILMASIAGHIGIKSHSIYSSTKVATTKLAKNFAYDLSDRGIRVNSISPGYIETPIFATRLAADHDFLKTKATKIPLKKIGTPKDIANAALFFASEESSYITGTDLIIDGGLSTTDPTEN